MLGTLVLAAMVSLSRAVKDANFEKETQNTLRDCRSTPEPYGECRLPLGLTADQVKSKLGGKDLAWWRVGDEFVVVADRDTDQAYLCCAARGRMDHVSGDLWGLRLRIIDLDHATMDIGVLPQPDDPRPVYRGPSAPPALMVESDIKGKVHLEAMKSEFLDEPRNATFYTPPGFDPLKKYPVLYMSDGNMRLNTPEFVEPLIESGALPPMVIVGIYYGSTKRDPDLRSREYLLGWPNSMGEFLKHENFLLKEVLPYAERNFGASSDPKDRIVTGFSSGAAWAVAMGLRHPDVFPNVIAQSMVWGATGGTNSNWETGMALSNPNGPAMITQTVRSSQLLDDLKNNPTTRFYLTAGTLEPRFYDQTLKFASAARAAGHTVEIETTVSGHTPYGWSPLMVRGLQWIFTGKASYAHEPPLP